MGIHRAGEASRGSQYGIQRYVNDRPLERNRAIHDAGGPPGAESTNWLSLVCDDKYSEYFDQDFLDLLGLKTTDRMLDDFWPSRGPHWDALGKTEATRFAWCLSKFRAEEAEVVLPTVQGLIRGAFVPQEWLPATPENFPGREDIPDRLGFKGEEAPAEMKMLYVGKRVPDEYRKQGAANPIRYTW